MRVWKIFLKNGTCQIWISPYDQIEINLGVVTNDFANDHAKLKPWLDQRLALIKSKI